MSSPTPQHSATYGVVLDQKKPKRSALRFNLTILFADWKVALTMVFGSPVGVWPPRSGIKIEIPEVDRGRWLTIDQGLKYIREDQEERLDRLCSAVRCQPS